MPCEQQWLIEILEILKKSLFLMDVIKGVAGGRVISKQLVYNTTTQSESAISSFLHR